MQKWIAWCEMRENKHERIERRQDLLTEHQEWQRSVFLSAVHWHFILQLFAVLQPSFCFLFFPVIDIFRRR